MTERSARRAARFVRLYPRQWREQFPDFVEFLAAELVDNRRGVRFDVVRTALTERLREAGIIPKRPAESARSGLALIYAALLPFAGLAMGMWSQLHTGLASLKTPTPPVLQVSNLLLTIGTSVAVVAFPLALVLLFADARRNRNDTGASAVARYRPLVSPSLAFMGSLVVLTVAGWGADRSDWYSPAAAALPSRGPGHLATLWMRGIIASITPAWIHPHLFAHMPAGEIAAALLAPVAAVAATVALFRLIVRVPLRAPRRANILSAATAFGMMLISVVACGRWLLDHPARQAVGTLPARSDQLAPGHTAWLVVVVLFALTLTALVGLRRVLRGGPDDVTPAESDTGTPFAEAAVAGSPIPLSSL